MLDEFKAAMKTKFEMNDLGLMKYFLGIEVEQSAQGIFVFQQKYTCKPTETPIALGTKLSKSYEGSTIDSPLYKRLVGSLMYLTTTRPDIMFAASFVSKFMESPKHSHWKFGKIILRYVAGTINYDLWYTTYEDYSLAWYTNSDFEGKIDDIKNTYGYAFHLGTNLISWASKNNP
jgi:hypothetical protein